MTRIKEQVSSNSLQETMNRKISSRATILLTEYSSKRMLGSLLLILLANSSQFRTTFKRLLRQLLDLCNLLRELAALPEEQFSLVALRTRLKFPMRTSSAVLKNQLNSIPTLACLVDKQSLVVSMNHRCKCSSKSRRRWNQLPTAANTHTVEYSSKMLASMKILNLFQATTKAFTILLFPLTMIPKSLRNLKAQSTTITNLPSLKSLVSTLKTLRRNLSRF